MTIEYFFDFNQEGCTLNGRCARLEMDAREPVFQLSPNVDLDEDEFAALVTAAKRKIQSQIAQQVKAQRDKCNQFLLEHDPLAQQGSEEGGGEG